MHDQIPMEEAIKQSNEKLTGNKYGYRRRTYKSEKDAIAEAQIAAIVAAKRNCRVQAMHSHSPIDFAAIQAVVDPKQPGRRIQKVRFWFEVKDRDIYYKQYETLFVSLHKWETGLARAKLTGRPFYFFARFNDGSIYFLEIHQTPHEANYLIAMGGNTQRGDPNDIEPVVHIPMDDLIMLQPPTQAAKQTAKASA